MVPLYSHRVSRVRRYSGSCSLISNVIYATLTLSSVASHPLRLKLINTKCSPNPAKIASHGLASFPFARHYSGNLGWFLFLALLRCFSSGGSPRIPIDSVYDAWIWIHADCSIRKSAGRSLLTAHRSLSQLTTSFVGSQCQGIRPALLLALPFVMVSEFFYIWKTCSFFTRLENNKLLFCRYYS